MAASFLSSKPPPSFSLESPHVLLCTTTPTLPRLPRSCQFLAASTLSWSPWPGTFQTKQRASAGGGNVGEGRGRKEPGKADEGSSRTPPYTWSPRGYCVQPPCFTSEKTEALRGNMIHAKLHSKLVSEVKLYSKPLGSWQGFFSYTCLAPPALHPFSPLCTLAFMLLGKVAGRIYL